MFPLKFKIRSNYIKFVSYFNVFQLIHSKILTILLFDVTQVSTCLPAWLVQGWNKRCSRVSPGHPMAICPCSVPHGTFDSWSSWPAKPLWFWFIWVDLFAVCLLILNPLLDVGPPA